ncbi:guanylate kinase [Ilyobacter polytropus]|uniref:Guanylate kinase n=1 Tax=Ilyobacter polytropus (strain ATCC 51220 / DSM 2926 / LMG 16218 / CuHBu1) TaxID=572544 RepID=E3H7L8_ILYPC|nr:guanylate kinase [Ilyobacter polytropus]ADO81972.1 guanylate kinase [Ilyobacter polytropus DSM 2926]
MKKGDLFVVSGPSGAGKSTVCKLVRRMLEINLAVSATTRAPRAGEVDGREYYFLTMEEFQNKIKNNEFLEYANVHGNYYGTLKSEVEERLNEGKNIILEIDVQGGIQAREEYPDVNLIFFKTPTKEDLEDRLRGRGTEDEETVRIRLENSLKELEFEKYYDKTVINHSIEQACYDLIKIIKKEA